MARPAPEKVRATRQQWRVYSAKHWAERRDLIAIVALGESIISIGTSVAGSPVSTARIVVATSGRRPENPPLGDVG